MKLLLPLLSLFLPKLKIRESNWKQIFNSVNIQKASYEKLIWFHAASMGEFEQAKYIIEELKKRNKNIKILVTFYSPSGYENQKNYKYADAVLYLPADTKGNVKKFLNKFNPDLAVFIRYEIWHNYLHQLSKRKIPVFLIAATKPGKSKLASIELVNQFYAMNYSYFNRIYTVGKEHSDFFESLYLTSDIITATDPRFDRIQAVVNKNKNISILPEEIFNGALTLIAGSTWQPDEDIIIPALEKLNHNKFNYRCIFVPHEPTKEHISILQNKVDAILLSELMNIKNINILKEKIHNKHIITDTIGKLLSLYSLGDLAYIGGAFGAGVHSVTEPAGYGLPLATGTKYKNSPDAVELQKQGALTIIKNHDEFEKWLIDLFNPEKRKQLGLLSAKYIQSKLGTSDKIVKDIEDAVYTIVPKK